MPTMSAVTHTDALGYASPRKWVTADRAEQIRVMSADRAERIRGRTVAGPPKHAAPDSPRTPTAKTRPIRALLGAGAPARGAPDARGGRRARHFRLHAQPGRRRAVPRPRAARRGRLHPQRARAARGRAGAAHAQNRRGAARGPLYVREVRQLDPRTVGSRVEVTLLRPHVTVEEKLLTLGDVRLEDGHDCAVPLRLQAVLEGGHALLSVLLDGRHVRGSPYPISVRSAAPFAPAAVLVAPDGSKVEAHAVAGERATLTLLLHDRYGNVAKSGAVAKRPAVHARLVAFGAPDVAHPAASPGAAARADAAAAGAIDLSVRDLGNGRYALGYSVTVAGSYQAELAVGGAAVSTPLCVHVHPAAPCDARDAPSSTLRSSAARPTCSTRARCRATAATCGRRSRGASAHSASSPETLLAMLARRSLLRHQRAGGPSASARRRRRRRGRSQRISSRRRPRSQRWSSTGGCASSVRRPKETSSSTAASWLRRRDPTCSRCARRAAATPSDRRVTCACAPAPPMPRQARFSGALRKSSLRGRTAAQSSPCRRRRRARVRSHGRCRVA